MLAVPGVPTGGPSEPLIDDESEIGGPSAAPTVSAQDADTAYQSLILGAGTSLSAIAASKSFLLVATEVRKYHML